MRPPDRYSTSPLPSWATQFGDLPTQHVLSFAETVRQIVQWLKGTRPSYQQRVREQRIVDLLAEQLEADENEGGR